MLEGDSVDTYAGKYLLTLIGVRVEGLACTDLRASTPIGMSRNFLNLCRKLKYWGRILHLADGNCSATGVYSSRGPTISPQTQFSDFLGLCITRVI